MIFVKVPARTLIIKEGDKKANEVFVLTKGTVFVYNNDPIDEEEKPIFDPVLIKNYLKILQSPCHIFQLNSLDSELDPSMYSFSKKKRDSGGSLSLINKAFLRQSKERMEPGGNCLGGDCHA